MSALLILTVFVLSPSHAEDQPARSDLPASETEWKKLPTEPFRGKQDDISFVTPDLGWYGNGSGKVFRTRDAGPTWDVVFEQPGTFVRCIAFVDENLGFFGNIGPGYFPGVTDTNPLYRTRDGGDTWEAVEAIEGDPIVGLCALRVLRSPYINAGNLDYKVTLFGVGRVGGPTDFIYSEDLGETWQQIELPGGLAMAFDIEFLNRKVGFIAAATSTELQETRPSIWKTTDGGQSWREVYQGPREFELTWKISFPTDEVGYVTNQSYNPDPAASERFLLKTADGGETWSELPIVNDHSVREFGVLFIDEHHGWVGAMPGGFETKDGGKTWRRAEFGNAVNKFHLLESENKTIIHSIGLEVHRLEIDQVFCR